MLLLQVLVTASQAPARADEESEGPSHAPESAMVAASTGKRQDADVASDSSNSVVACPSDSFFFFLGRERYAYTKQR